MYTQPTISQDRKLDLKSLYKYDEHDRFIMINLRPHFLGEAHL